MRNRVAASLLIAACAAVAACDSGFGPPSASPPSTVTPDGRYAVAGVPAWNLVGNALTPGQDSIEIDVTAPSSAEVVDVWVAGGAGQRLTPAADGHFTGTLAIGGLAAGEHDILVAANGSDTAVARVLFNRTHPLYFMLSTDWDFSEPGQVALDYHDQVREQHPDVKYTHFVGPYTFTDPNLAEARKAELASWVKARRDQYGDEIGLHIHPYCHFVTSAGVTCNTTESTVYQDDPSGYTIKLEVYGVADFETLLVHAADLFDARGMGKPVTFRAGGWTASIDTLTALANKGFVADTSANNWARMEEWRNNGNLYTWNMTNWSMIGDTSQPYHPNTTDKQSGTAPNLSILEVPDNAIMVDYVTTAEMIEIFGENWSGTPLTEPRTFMMGFHPSPNMSVEEYRRIDGILDHADMFLASAHAGPVVYVVLEDMATVWPAP